MHIAKRGCHGVPDAEKLRSVPAKELRRVTSADLRINRAEEIRDVTSGDLKEIYGVKE